VRSTTLPRGRSARKPPDLADRLECRLECRTDAEAEPGHALDVLAELLLALAEREAEAKAGPKRKTRPKQAHLQPQGEDQR
jgi:hypothetical protein